MSDAAATPTPSAGSESDVITLGGGCFWCLEAVYLDVEGVLSVESGYSNGRLPHPSYEQVCSGSTGCVEVVQVRFDPRHIGLAELLEIFFVIHDPTTLNRQGNDAGTQYRSGIYWHRPEQEAVARAVAAQAAAHWPDPLVTEIVPLRDYSAAEAYHQRYFELHPQQAYCAYVVAPKLAKFRATFAARRRQRSA
jgi:peptide-methionine (S)-S-oxide reductase